MLKLIADANIPLVDKLFSAHCKIVQKSNNLITTADLLDAEILLVRSVTSVTAQLLENTAVKFVGNCAAGKEHIEQTTLEQRGITVAHASGANADAVVTYVIACCEALSLQLANMTLGIIGYGNIGEKLVQKINKSVASLLIHDPLLPNSTPLNALLEHSDLISLHASLTRHPPHPTFHLLHQGNLGQSKKNLVLINTARGALIETEALLRYPRTLCLDVWENEPAISLALLDKTTIATPHIAGYSAAAKQLATKMIFNAAADRFGWEKISLTVQQVDPEGTPYNLQAESDRFRQAFTQATPETVADIFKAERASFYDRF